MVILPLNDSRYGVRQVAKGLFMTKFFQFSKRDLEKGGRDKLEMDEVSLDASHES